MPLKLVRRKNPVHYPMKCDTCQKPLEIGDQYWNNNGGHQQYCYDCGEALS